MSLIRKLAVAYAIMFFAIASLSYVPGLADAQGYTFGLFKLDIWDDLLHAASGLWALIAAWRSEFASRWYFKAFGLIYFFDGVLGFLLGQGYLDLGIVLHGVTQLPLSTRFFANLPHLVIGGLAIAIGFLLRPRAVSLAEATS